MLLLGFINAAALACGVGVLQFTPSFLQEYHGSSEHISLYLLAGSGAAQVIGTPLGARGHDALGQVRRDRRLR